MNVTSSLYFLKKEEKFKFNKKWHFFFLKYTYSRWHRLSWNIASRDDVEFLHHVPYVVIICIQHNENQYHMIVSIFVFNLLHERCQ